MATDLLFPFYEIMVETIFGSIFLAIMGLAMIILLILFLTRTSWNFIIFYITFYFMVMGTLYVGALGMVLVFMIVLIYAMIALMRLIAGAYINI